MMIKNKECILVLAALLSLPGCIDRKKKAKEPKKMAKKVDIFSSVNIPLADDNEDDVDNVRVLSFFDEEIQEFSTTDDDFNISVAVETGQQDAASLSADQDFTWVEAADMDNEFKVVYFGFGDYDVRSDQEGAVELDIAQVNQLLAQSEETQAEPTIVIEGHACHSAGSPAYNLALSERRAKKIADRFVASGISQDNIKVVGRGQEVPALIDEQAVTGSSEEQWANRRVEVRVIYT